MKQPPPWWIRPDCFLLGVLLPLFLAACFVASTSIEKFRVPGNYVDASAVLLGGSSIIALALGAFLTIAASRRRSAPQVRISPVGQDRVLRLAGALALIANTLLLVGILQHPDLIVSFLHGTRGASDELKEAFGRIPGVTSLVQLQMIFFSLYAVATVEPRYIVRNDIRAIFWLLVIFTVIRTFAASERLALVELLAPLAMMKIAFHLRSKVLRNGGPFIAGALVFFLFAVGEYFRSWQYYKQLYDDYFDFAITRFFGYFATSVNNGAGIVSNFTAPMFPGLTASWFYKFPLWPILGIDMDKPTVVSIFLTRYGNLEFNNPGGLYVAYADFGIVLGLLVYLILGVITGYLFVLFMRKNAFGLILYPAWFIGVADILRIFYWGDSRFFPVVVFGLLFAFYIQRPVARRPRLLGTSNRGLSSSVPISPDHHALARD